MGLPGEPVATPKVPSALPWRRLALPAFGPSLIGSVGSGAIAPVLALAARDLGASVSTAALIVAVAAVSEFVCSVTVGIFIDKVGERLALTLAALLDVGVGLLGWWAPSVATLAAAAALLGPAGGVLIVARQSFLGHVVPPAQRARAMSTLGGVARIGWFLGPLIAAPFIAGHGARAAFLVLAAAGIVAAAVTWWSMDLPAVGGWAGQGARAATTAPTTSFCATVRTHSRVLLTLGGGVLVIGLARSARTVIVPLWAEHIGLSASAVAVLFGLAMGLEVLLFYPAGWVMDRFGRVWIAVPVAAGFAVALLLLPLATTYAGLAACVVGMALANGLGSGIVMTLGADAAPVEGKAAFLGVWRLSSLIGVNGASVLVALVAGLASLSAAALVLGVCCALGAGWLARWVPAYDPRRAGGILADDPTVRPCDRQSP